MTLVDTSSWIEQLRKGGDAAVRARVELLLSHGDAAWCDIVRLELWNGARGETERKILTAMNDTVPLVETNRDAWDLAVEIVRRARGKGVTVPVTDAIVWSCARVRGVDLEHHDRHFELIDSL